MSTSSFSFLSSLPQLCDLRRVRRLGLERLVALELPLERANDLRVGVLLDLVDGIRMNEPFVFQFLQPSKQRADVVPDDRPGLAMDQDVRVEQRPRGQARTSQKWTQVRRRSLGCLFCHGVTRYRPQWNPERCAHRFGAFALARRQE